MIGNSPNQKQKHLFLVNLAEFINPNHRLCLLAEKIDWQAFEANLAPLYPNFGAPAKPIRLMVGLLILKQVFNLGDETVVEEWVSNPYFQYFCGQAMFQWKFPCDPSDLVHFRHRIGAAGVEKILAASILIHGEEMLNEDVSIDTTVQPKNITYPTETKLAVRIIKQCRQIAEKEGVKLRQSYKFEAKDKLKVANSKSAKQAKQRKKAKKRLKTIAGILVRELSRKLSREGLQKNAEKLEIYEKVLSQKQNEKDKIYSLHALEVACIAKGKEHKKYEFGSKVAFSVGQKSNLIKGIVSFRGNPNDNKTLEKTLAQQERMTGERPKNAYTDRGCKSQQIGETKINTPSNGAGKSASEKARLRKSFRRRAAIEPDIGHLKSDFGLERNYLKGEVGDAINAMLAGSAFNFKSWMRKSLAQIIFVINYLNWKLKEMRISTIKRFVGELSSSNFKTISTSPQIGII